jgi:hypothetical protein
MLPELLYYALMPYVGHAAARKAVAQTTSRD